MTKNKPNVIMHCNCTTEVCKFYNLKEQESEIAEEFCWSESKNQKLDMWPFNLLVWRRKIRSLIGTCLDFLFLPKKKKFTQVSVLRNSRRWGLMGHHSCTGGKKLWKFCLESKEMRRSKGSWFINLAMVERNYERA
jgi:hypothetical protein